MSRKAYNILRLLRPRQWVKNFAIFAAVTFTGELFNPVAVFLLLFVLLFFSLFFSQPSFLMIILIFKLMHLFLANVCSYDTVLNSISMCQKQEHKNLRTDNHISGLSLACP